MNSIAAELLGPAPLAPRHRTPFHHPALGGAAAWRSLSAATPARLDAPHACFVGAITLHANALGRCFAQMCRPVGLPLPPSCAAQVVSTVEVTHDVAGRGHRWTRGYALPSRTFTVSSAKTMGHRAARSSGSPPA